MIQVTLIATGRASWAAVLWSETAGHIVTLPYHGVAHTTARRRAEAHARLLQRQGARRD